MGSKILLNGLIFGCCGYFQNLNGFNLVFSWFMDGKKCGVQIKNSYNLGRKGWNILDEVGEFGSILSFWDRKLYGSDFDIFGRFDLLCRIMGRIDLEIFCFQIWWASLFYYKMNGGERCFNHRIRVQFSLCLSSDECVSNQVKISSDALCKMVDNMHLAGVERLTLGLSGIDVCLTSQTLANALLCKVVSHYEIDARAFLAVIPIVC